MAERVLIVNADDFGLSPGVNAGVVQAHEHGILTSASLMVRSPAAAEAAAYARGAPGLSLGLHVDLGEWVLRDGDWQTVYEVVPLDDPDAVVGGAAARSRPSGASRAATRRTSTRTSTSTSGTRWWRSFRHARARSWACRCATTPRASRTAATSTGSRLDGTPIPDAITVETLVDIIAGLPAGRHRARLPPGLGGDSGSALRPRARGGAAVLCDPRVREALEREGVALRSFADIASGGAA